MENITETAALEERAKYYMSVMNIKEFMADSLGRQFQGIISNALSKL